MQRNLVALLALVIAAGCSDDSSSTEPDAQIADAANDQALVDATPATVDAPAPQVKTVTSGDVSLHVHVAGNTASGNVMLAIHGGPGLTGDYLASLDQLAGNDFAVVRFDQRGCGKSTAPSQSGYATLDYLNDLEAVRTAVVGQQGKVHVLGHSWGGYLAMAYTAVHGAQVSSLVLASAMPVTRDELNAANTKFFDRVAQLQQQGLIPDPYDLSTLDDILPAYLADPALTVPAELQGIPYAEAVNQATISALGPYDISQDVAGITVPALVTFGDGEPFGVEMGQSGYNALSAATPRWVLLKSCGHFWHECPAEFFAELRAFYQLDS